MSNPAIGAPVYGTNKKKNFKIKDGSNIYRILPPFASFAQEGRWAIFESIHWGFKGTKGLRTFRCPLKKNAAKMVTTPCAECAVIAERLAEKDRQTKLLEAQGKTPAEIKDFLKPLTEWLFSHNKDNKWYLNVQNLAGEIGRLAMPHKMYQALQAEIADLIKKRLDPVGAAGGVQFDFFRSGTFNQTVHKVSTVKESITLDGGESVEKIKRMPLTEDTIKRMATEAYDLKDMFRTVTPEDVSRLVASGNDPIVVDSVFTAPETVRTPEDNEEPDASELASGAIMAEVVAAVATLAPKVETAPAVLAVVTPSVATPVSDNMAKMAAMEAELARLRASNAEATKATSNTAVKIVVPNPTPVVTATDVKTMNNDDFLAQFGAGKL